jgi:hypothetical protein
MVSTKGSPHPACSLNFYPIFSGGGDMTGRVRARNDGEARLCPSCPGLSRASTSYFLERAKDVDGRVKPGHDVERLVLPVLRQRQPEHLRQIRDLRWREISRVQPAQQQIEFCGFFQLLDREHGGFQRIA